jgi:outer membrane protein OmpA-like peptidoglycan-associated protein
MNVLYRQNDRHSRLMKRRLSLLNYPQPNLIQPKTIILKVDTLTVNDISFESGKASLNNESLRQLDDFVSKVDKVLVDSLIIHGHTDNTGSFKLNESLSTNRSLSVLNYIQSKINLSSEKAIIRSFADKHPLASNKTVGGRRKNRRVEIFIYSHL